MKDLFLALWSGGKDSSWMILEILGRKLKLDHIVTYDTPELPEMYEYKEVFADYVKTKYGVSILTIPTGRMDTVYKWSLGEYTKGNNKGMLRGFPKISSMTWCTRELKVYPYNRYIKKHFKDRNIKKYYGIAADEPRRINKDENGIYTLNDLNLTELDCLNNLKSVGLHNPVYDFYSRTGCWFCPKQDKKGFRILYDNWPKMWDQLLDWENELNFRGNVHIDQIVKEYTVSELTQYFENQDKQMELF